MKKYPISSTINCVVIHVLVNVLGFGQKQHNVHQGNRSQYAFNRHCSS